MFLIPLLGLDTPNVVCCRCCVFLFGVCVCCGMLQGGCLAAAYCRRRALPPGVQMAPLLRVCAVTCSVQALLTRRKERPMWPAKKGSLFRYSGAVPTLLHVAGCRESMCASPLLAAVEAASCLGCQWLMLPAQAVIP